MSNSFQPPQLQPTRLLCPPLSPRVCSNSCPRNRWCYLTISSSVTPSPFAFSLFPASESLVMSWLFELGSQSIGASATVPQMKIQGWFPLELTGLIPLQSKGFLGVFSRTTVRKYQFFSTQLSLRTNSHIHTWLLEKPRLCMDLCQQSDVSAF